MFSLNLLNSEKKKFAITVKGFETVASYNFCCHALETLEKNSDSTLTKFLWTDIIKLFATSQEKVLFIQAAFSDL